MTPLAPAHAAAGTWELFTDPGEFDRAAGPYLRSDPALHTVQLTVTAGLLADEARFQGVEARFGVWRDGAGQVAGSFLWTPPHPLTVSPLGEEAAEGLVAALDGAAPKGVGGVVEGAEAVARAWARRRPGGAVEQRFAQRLYRLGTLTPPRPGPAGRARVADSGDLELLIGWIQDFHEAVGDESDAERIAGVIEGRLSYGGLTLWETPDGTPVSLAGVQRRTAGSVRVAPVFTPEERRGRGYGAAVTAEVSRAAVAGGADEVVLFTDLANETSNALYQRLGYRPVRDFAVWAFAEGV
ncbi:MULTISPECIES: GNAT family N-acetyltransferase [unclassified Streptomyces]|uniref:GNAT family N-acetyltransferase n=1 Tax=unclassified Streptomyces TaxID=2593676 RepID=UPI000DB9BAE6|nr:MULTISPECIES: GNAT family N-acetyltransferase [unclassified Streptomyces]MYT72096.1 GNAT family N-acetyltransferase [Streptomyces sp. SID8367]RAJ81507.1 FR47-like protein [Streptomyces sp. PsTaAH-137]